MHINTCAFIDPAKAEKYLNSNTGNRTMRPGLAEKYAADAKELYEKLIATHIGLNPEAQRQMIAGEMEVDSGQISNTIAGLGPPAHWIPTSADR